MRQGDASQRRIPSTYTRGVPRSRPASSATVTTSDSRGSALLPRATDLAASSKSAKKRIPDKAPRERDQARERGGGVHRARGRVGSSSISTRQRSTAGWGRVGRTSLRSIRGSGGRGGNSSRGRGAGGMEEGRLSRPSFGPSTSGGSKGKKSVFTVGSKSRFEVVHGKKRRSRELGEFLVSRCGVLHHRAFRMRLRPSPTSIDSATMRSVESSVRRARIPQLAPFGGSLLRSTSPALAAPEPLLCAFG